MKKEIAVLRRLFLRFLIFSASLCLAAPPCALAVPPPDPQTGKGPWELVRSDHGITVHRRSVSGSNLHEFRGSGVIEAPISRVLAVLNDSEHRLEWMAEAVDNHRIEQLGQQSEILYSRTKAPWPVADRDVVLRADTTFDGEAGQVRIELVSQEHPSMPPQKGVVRMPFLRGHWYLWPENNGAFTRAEYQIHANPGGMLTTFIINQVSKKIPHETIAGIKRQVQHRSYPEFEKKIEATASYQAVLAKATTSAKPAPTTPAASAAAPTPNVAHD
jgi:hypothetical protein